MGTFNYYRPMTDANGLKLNYEQRRTLRRQQEAERRAARKAEPQARSEIYNLPYEQRRVLREQERQGKREGELLAKQAAEDARKRQEAAIPDYERRRENVYTKLIKEWSNKAHLPDVARKLARYRQLEAEEEAKIDAEQAAKLRQHLLDTDPEVIKAREHFASAIAAAETPEEQAEWAKCRGLIDGGASGEYWARASELLNARLQRIQARAAAEAEGRAEAEARQNQVTAEADEAAQLLAEVPNE